MSFETVVIMIIAFAVGLAAYRIRAWSQRPGNEGRITKAAKDTW